jgi:hypothetical protein
MKLAFIIHIHPILEYNSIVWSPNFSHLIDLIEKVQRKFLERISILLSLHYAERLALLDWQLLELCRLQLDLICYFKMINHLTAFKPEATYS